MRNYLKLKEEICEELKKVPNIRYVCRKVGIDRSTFYRWLSNHFGFQKEVEAALLIGRDTVNDMAQSVIINGVQNSDVKCAMYWLSHNHERYISPERVDYFELLENRTHDLLTKKKAEYAKFDELFEAYFIFENSHGKEIARELMDIVVTKLVYSDAELKQIFFEMYKEYKEFRIENFNNKLKYIEVEGKYLK